ncbi:universal stress protein [Saccharopolyspora sp. K220]|uniref:universal stress protein n=1 Tax=Saccharopolyspora soli TaxID=2926618 RepID=UPI001F56EE24|nr:universal stress protein [Saccharopolyspora soli]MCI2416420.1 universal stress protein [Saccharopolyspora soli]
MRREVLAGVDGSAESVTAALWAADEAALRGVPLRLLTVDAKNTGDHAWNIVRSARQWCHRAHGGIDIAEDVLAGYPPQVLVRESTDAQLLVVGSRGLGAVTETLLGSVSMGVAMRANCPVVVVPRRRGSFALGPVVLGVSGPSRGRAAISFAFAEAALRGTALLAVHVWRPISWTEPAQLAAWSTMDGARQDLTAELVDWASGYPDVQLSTDVRYGSPADELSQAASAAQLLVIGHCGTALALGTVAHRTLHHADCPVAIVREEHRREDIVFFEAGGGADERQVPRDSNAAP